MLAGYRNEFRYMTISGWNADRLRELGLESVLVPPGIDLENFRPLPDVQRRDDMLLALGRTNPLKNLPLTTLDLWSCNQVNDLTPLQALPLTTLNLQLCGQVRDLTRQVKYGVVPPDVVAVDATGYVTALRDGQATITASGPDGLTANIAVTVTEVACDLPVNFANDVVPIFTRFGCNRARSA